MVKKLILLGGPSCVGKGPLVKALCDLHPEIEFAEPVWYHSRAPRLKKNTLEYEMDGVDYHFRSKSFVGSLDRKRFIVGNLRSEIQALDTFHLKDLFAGNDIVFSEIYYSFLPLLMEWLERQDDVHVEVRSVFIMPLGRDELHEMTAKTGKTSEQLIYEIMKKKLERRGEDPPEKIEERARSAYEEIKNADLFTDIIVNHAGEDDLVEWGRPPGPEASRVVEEFASVFLRARDPSRG